jgi:hypothetical protein
MGPHRCRPDHDRDSQSGATSARRSVTEATMPLEIVTLLVVTAILAAEIGWIGWA